MCLFIAFFGNLVGSLKAGLAGRLDGDAFLALGPNGLRWVDMDKLYVTQSWLKPNHHKPKRLKALNGNYL